MKIAIIIYSLEGGGAQRVASFLANSWVHNGAEICLVTFVETGQDAYPLSDKVERISLNMSGNSTNLLAALLMNAKRVRALRNLILESRPDAVVALMTGAAVTALLATRGLGISTFVSERIHPPLLPLGWFWERLRKMTYPMAAQVVMLTQEGLQWLKDTIPPAKGVVIPNPVIFPLPEAEPMPIGDYVPAGRNLSLAVDDYVPVGRNLLLSVGRLYPQKQFNQLIEVFHRLSAQFPNWDLVILGDGSLRHNLGEQIKNLGLSERVKLPGRAGNVGKWYERADIFAMSSGFEGFPNVLVEAMAYGCPAVSYDCDTGPRDIIRDGVDGVLVPVGDVTMLGEALADIMGNTSKREAMGTRAKEVAKRFASEKVFSMWDGMVRQYVRKTENDS
jgi:glycosyltransferase involved in cell wall biosynthesis